jgi:hypothetical protein
LAEASTIVPQERAVQVCFDALTRKLVFISPEQLYKPREMRELGYFEVPAGMAKRPEIEDVPMQDFDRVLQRQRAKADRPIELLAVRRIERRELHYMGCTMLFYRSETRTDDIDVAFWREDGPALEHESCFRDVGGPELVGCKLLVSRQTTDAMRMSEVETAEPVETSAREGEVTAVLDDTVESVLCHEHPTLLRKALLTAQKRLLIISPWIRHQVVNWEFVASLEALLRSGVSVYIGYGIDDGE